MQVQFWNVRTYFIMTFCFLGPVLFTLYLVSLLFYKFWRHLPLLPSLHISVWGMNPLGCEYIIRLRPDGNMFLPQIYIRGSENTGQGHTERIGYESSDSPMCSTRRFGYHTLSRPFSAADSGSARESKPKWLQSFSGYHSYNPTSGRRIQHQVQMYTKFSDVVCKLLCPCFGNDWLDITTRSVQNDKLASKG
ncbi:uncharacterized protein EURHEDRAFT_246037 [Aspergillus ruber CBS 135680]|uniref:Uncharacterized protein n=1 Tax=Aspergillus ruber (strain CBS 135680) TaxID=1388766 RepID=A0A017S3U1_ASPRC|nr:uncharacterized protein EURHEDRAFT_246037 [Aspergillus ruber CBS 135680]EYE91299.1 hypothetical protein EURHEDRAFT_246037 [Aspergillus ruber CBS 135680]